MKGTIAILGCLLAAYAAPLFANEVPLILEETIQLPMATGAWDVAPNWRGEYDWVAMRAENLNVYSYWQTGVDSAIRVDSVSYAWSLGVGVYQIALVVHGGDLHVVSRATASFFGGSFGGSVHHIRAQNLRSGEIGLWCSWGDHQDGWPHNIRTYDHYTPIFLSGAGTPPDELVQLPMRLSYQVREGNGDPSRVYQAGSDIRSSCDLVSFPVHSHASVSDWAEVPIAGFIVPSGPGWVVHHATIDDTLITVQTSDTISTSGIVSLRAMEEMNSFYSAQQVAVALTTDGALNLLYEGERQPRSVFANGYLNLLPAYVLLSDYSEQALALRPTRQFDVIRLDDSIIWGQTTPLDSGYSEMKIVGRYHNETRRLVVRYGSELRIYRFGEPIYTDADDARPELPSELSLSAYPNPFNPTTMIAFDLPKAGRAKLVVYDLNGRLVRTLLDEQMSAGHHEFGFDGAALPSGIYFARLSAGELVRTQKLVLLK